ncbi:hypothetical protein ACVWVZ_005462 [Pseudomonas tolaasii]
MASLIFYLHFLEQRGKFGDSNFLFFGGAHKIVTTICEVIRVSPCNILDFRPKRRHKGLLTR